MRKLIFTTIFAFIIGIALGQSVEITDHNNSVVNFGDTVRYNSTNLSESIHTVEFTAKNTSTSTKTYKVRQMMISEVATTMHYFCFGSCYAPGTNLSPTGVDINAGESTAPNAFSTDYMPQGLSGITIIAYSVFDEANTSDSLYFIVKYNIAIDASIENANKLQISNAYPNPANNDFTVEYKIKNAQTANIEILNILGSKVLVQEISTNDNRIKLDISTLKAGVYFYNIIVDGNKEISKKLIVR